MVWSFDWWGVGGTADYCHGMSGILESGREFRNWCALKIRENTTRFCGKYVILNLRVAEP